MKRSQLSRGTKSLKRTSLKKRQKSKEEIAENRVEQEEMWNFFIEIWNERGPYSEISGKFLGSEILTTFFHHILPKSKYPEYKLYKPNIIIVTFEEHQKAEQDIYFYNEINMRRNRIYEM